MKKFAVLTFAICFAACLTTNAQETRITPGMSSGANGMEGHRSKNHNDKSDFQDGATCEGEECPIMAAAMETLPKMVFRIGDEETCCHMTATRLAHESEEKILYIVGEKKYRDAEDAFSSLVKQTERHVRKFVTPVSDSGTTTVAGESCQNAECAEKMTQAVTTATQDLAVSYRVGDKDFQKKGEAKRYAIRMHQRGAFVVGDEKFENELEARLALAHQKFRSAVAAVQTVKSELAEETTDATDASTELAANDG